MGVKNKKQIIKTVIIVGLIVFVIGIAAFTYFRIATEGRLALRKGKNVKLALDMLDIEFYREKKTVYNPNRPDGLEQGVRERLNNIVGDDGRFNIVSYDSNKRKIEYMIYEEDNYRVIYRYDEDDGDIWKVEYIVTILDYSDKK